MPLDPGRHLSVGYLEMETIDVQKSAFLDARDLAACQSVFDELLKEIAVARNSEEAERIAAIVIELYRQGVRDASHLKVMVESARGLFGRSKPKATVSGYCFPVARDHWATESAGPKPGPDIAISERK
jgi:hypothetical protein